MPADAAFWDRIAGRYAARPVSDPEAYARKLEATRRHMPPGAEVLELGCGTGTTALWHAGKAGRIHALDISPQMIRIAREKAARAGAGNVRFEVGAVETFEAPESSFDMVMAHSLLHLLSDRDGAIAAAHRLLRPGGLFVSSTACLADGYWPFRPLLAIMRAFGKAPFVRFFSRAELRQAMEGAGFEIVEEQDRGRFAALFLIARKPVG